MGHTTILPLLAPILWLQGRRVRARALQLPEPPGPRSGTCGSGHPTSLLVLGDSSAAGVGAPDQASALTGQLVNRLGATARLDWTLIARTGATTASTLRRLEREPHGRFDIAVLCLGVNDVTSGANVHAWSADQARLRALLRERFGVRYLIVNGLPPMARFPLLPRPLRGYLGDRARTLTARLESDLATETDCRFLPLDFDDDATAMAADGFHPGPAIYARWAARVAGSIEGILPSGSRADAADRVARAP